MDLDLSDNARTCIRIFAVISGTVSAILIVAFNLMYQKLIDMDDKSEEEEKASKAGKA